MVEVVAFAGALTHAGENAIATMTFGDIVNQFLNDNGFADASTAECADLATFHEGADEINDFDAGLEDFDARGLVFQGGSFSVNGPTGCIGNIGFVVNRLTEDVKDTTE